MEVGREPEQTTAATRFPGCCMIAGREEMSESIDLQKLGSPEVRNAVLLNEIGVLLHDLGKLSTEFIAGEHSFPHHLILRRLTRGRDPWLGPDNGCIAAIRCSLKELYPEGEENAIAELLLSEMRKPRRQSCLRGSFEGMLEAALNSTRTRLAPEQEVAFDRVSRLVKAVSAGLTWQREQEAAIAAIEPPFISVAGFHEGLDQLPFVANLVEMQGRSWHPEPLLPPEVKLLRALRDVEEIAGAPEASHGDAWLGEARQLYCEVLANQLLEIYNIRKDGPGDLGSWFWKARLYPRSDRAMELLRRFDEGSALGSEELETVRWLGVRPISEWAYGKVILGENCDGRPVSLWEHSYQLASLHKSALAQAIIEGRFHDPAQPSYRILRVRLNRSAPQALERVKELVEVEYPLGNELMRTEHSVHFTFPDLDDESAAQVRQELGEEVTLVVDTGLQPQLTFSPTTATMSRGASWAADGPIDG